MLLFSFASPLSAFLLIWFYRDVCACSFNLGSIFLHIFVTAIGGKSVNSLAGVEISYCVIAPGHHDFIMAIKIVKMLHFCHPNLQPSFSACNNLIRCKVFVDCECGYVHLNSHGTSDACKSYQYIV